MKSLQESLFDKNLATQEMSVFGDLYEPEEIYYGGWVENMKIVGNMFVMSKLKKDIKPISLDNINVYNEFKEELKYLPYVLAKVNELPLEPEFLSNKNNGNYTRYGYALDLDMRPYQKSGNHFLVFTIYVWNYEPQLQISKRYQRGTSSITIKYKRK